MFLKELTKSDFASVLEEVRRNNWWADLDAVFSELELGPNELTATLWS
jgi:hypothetical protein